MPCLIGATPRRDTTVGVAGGAQGYPGPPFPARTTPGGVGAL